MGEDQELQLEKELEMIRITEDLSIHEGELTYTFSHSSKPGGQNVNKVSTRVTLNFDVGNSPSLSDDQRERIRSELRTRINKEGILRVSSQKHRTQKANREAATERFVELVQEALRERPVRKKRGIPREIRERRLKDKKHRSRLKRDRTKLFDPDE
jgi:ribosome-associated protein